MTIHNEPVPPADLVECDACPTSGGCVGKCMKAPAGGDVEVLGYWCAPKEAPLQGRYIEARHADLEAGGFSESFAAVFNVTELVDRAHVTRLQAEVERLGKRVEEEVATAISNELKSERDVLALQAELTKAREFARRYQWLRAGGDRPSGDRDQVGRTNDYGDKYTLLAGYEHEDATGYDRNTYQLTGEELDAAVDLAMGADWHDKADIAVSNQSAPADKGGDS